MAVKELAIPARLPVDHLSVSSVNAYLRCPLKWKLRYIERFYEPPSGQLILGSSIHAAEGASYQHQIDNGQRLAVDDTLDLFSDEWEDRIGREDVEWGKENADKLKDDGVAVVKAYDEHIAPSVVPVSVEREYRLTFDGVEWGFLGYLDIEDEAGDVIDMKVKGKRLSEAEARVDIQPTANLLARRVEGNPAPAFKYHTLVRTKSPTVEVVPTVRSDAQLDAFQRRLFVVAAEIGWRLENDTWQGAVPGSWWCSDRFCGYWSQCEFGGAR